MNAATRQHVRHLLNQHAHQQRQAFIDAGELTVCHGCGCELGDYMPGCERCQDRRRRTPLATRKASSDLCRTVEG